jgi:hypothetical protein
LIEITVLAQREDQCPFTTEYDQEMSFYCFRKEALSNPHWYQIFNTKVDVRETIGVTRQHNDLVEYVEQETHTSAFMDLGGAERLVVWDDTEEWYISYAFLWQRGNQHGNLKVGLQYPKNHQQTLHLLDKYSKTDVAKVTQYEDTSFAQRSGRGGGRGGNSRNKKAMTILIRNIGRTRLVTSLRKRVTLQTSALRSQTMTMMTIRY